MTKRGLNNLPLPTSDVQAAPLVAVLINSAWSEVLLSALSILEESKTWADGADTTRAELQTYFLYDQIRQAMALTAANISDFSEAVDDRVAALLVAGSKISLTYNDTANTLTISFTGLSSSDIPDFSEAVDDRVSALLTAGNKISLTYNDAGNTLAIAFTGLTSLSDLPAISKGVLLGTAPGTGTATPQEITVGSNLALSGSVLNAAVYYPWVQNLFQDGATYPFATPSRTFNSGLVYGYVITVASPANGNYFEHIFPLAAGSYKVSVLGWKQNNAGKIDWTLDGDAVASGQDWYAASSTPNTTQTFTMLNLTKNGLYTLRGTINGKNAASSNYFHYITKITIVPNVGVMP